MKDDKAAPDARVPTLEHWDISIARDGTWFHEGRPIRREGLVRLFASVLKRADDGSYWLETPAERGEVRVADVPFLAVALTAEGEGVARRLTFRTNLDESVTAGPDNPIRVAIDRSTGEPTPYILVRDGLEARIVRPVFYELAEEAVPWAPSAQASEQTPPPGSASMLGVWSDGSWFPIGPSS